MALFPEEVAARAFANARDLFTWVGLDADDVLAIEAVTGAFGDSIRNVALLPFNTVKPSAEAAVTGPAEAPRPIPIVKRAQFGLAWRIARRITAPAWQAYHDVDPFDSTPVPVAAPATTAMLSQPSVQKKLKMNVVLDQSDDTEMAVAEDSLVAKWFAAWQAFAQGPAEPEEEPSVEQLTALYARVITLKKLSLIHI